MRVPLPFHSKGGNGDRAREKSRSEVNFQQSCVLLKAGSATPASKIVETNPLQFHTEASTYCTLPASLNNYKYAALLY